VTPFTDKQLATIQLRGIRCPVCGETQFLDGRPLSLDELKSATRICSNEKCGSPLYQFTRRRSESQIRGSFKLFNGYESSAATSTKGSLFLFMNWRNGMVRP
jgi:hypothetical protein